MSTKKDNLTGLNTEEYLKVELDNECARARRFGRELALLLLEPEMAPEDRADVGYSVLKSVARAVTEVIRKIDEGVRWGQQVVVVLPETTRDGAEQVASRVKDAFAAIPVLSPTSGEPVAARLRSVVVVFPHDAQDKGALLQEARYRMDALDLEEEQQGAPADAEQGEPASSEGGPDSTPA